MMAKVDCVRQGFAGVVRISSWPILASISIFFCTRKMLLWRYADYAELIEYRLLVVAPPDYSYLYCIAATT